METVVLHSVRGILTLGSEELTVKHYNGDFEFVQENPLDEELLLMAINEMKDEELIDMNVNTVILPNGIHVGV